MSDFLVNLARRSAGLAPVVRARVAPIVVADDADTRAAEPQASRGGAVGAEMVRGEFSPGPRTSVGPTVAPMASPIPIAAATTHVAPPGVQRALVAQSVAPSAPARPAPVARAADAPAVSAPRAHVALEPAPSARTVAPPPIAQQSSPTSSETHERPTATLVSVIVPAAAARPEPVRERDPDRLTHIETREEVRVIERAVPVPNDAEARPVIAIEPAERPSMTDAVARAEPAPERTVFVRIGAIEIHGADGAAQAPVAAAPAAVPAAAATATAPGGFDDFAALRSYTPWAW